MKTMYNLNRDFEAPMDRYREWVFSPDVQKRIHKIFEPLAAGKLSKGEAPTSHDYLMSLDHERHSGLPGDFLGINLNSQILRKHVGDFAKDFVEEAQTKSDELDEELQDILGAKICALKMFYPQGGFIDWHTNWDSPGYNVIFTYSPTGNGYWRHVDPKGAINVTPRLDRVVHIDDRPGWHCKAGYFGTKNETDRLVWHSAYTREPRLTLSYIIYEKSIWENLVEELNESAAVHA